MFVFCIMSVFCIFILCLRHRQIKRPVSRYFAAKTDIYNFFDRAYKAFWRDFMITESLTVELPENNQMIAYKSPRIVGYPHNKYPIHKPALNGVKFWLPAFLRTDKSIKELFSRNSRGAHGKINWKSKDESTKIRTPASFFNFKNRISKKKPQTNIDNRQQKNKFWSIHTPSASFLIVFEINQHTYSFLRPNSLVKIFCTHLAVFPLHF